MSVSMFSVYVLMGNVLKASQIFLELSIFSSLMWLTLWVHSTPLPPPSLPSLACDAISSRASDLQLLDLLSQWVKAKTSLERLILLRLEEIPGGVDADEDDQLADGSIRIVDGQFEWQRCNASDDCEEDDRSSAESVSSET
jgi:hypothetical protein